MPVQSKTFTYEVEGLSYTVLVYEDPENAGQYLADITVSEGAMDVNAVYFGDSDFSGESEMLGGPLNMNGARSNDEDVQWDSAVKLSDPGLGPMGTEKDTYVETGDTLTLSLDIDSLDEIEVFGIRATSTTTEDGSIKAVSEEEEDDATFDKVGFGVAIDDNGGIANGIFIFEDNLPEGEEGTFENYVNYFESQFGEDPDYNITQVESVIFYELTEERDADGNLQEIPHELFRIDAPEGGFESSDELLEAYDELIETGEFDDLVASEGSELELLATLNHEETPEEEDAEEIDSDEEELDLV